MEKDTLLKVDNLKTYFYKDGNEIPSVDGISFKLKKGEITAIVGESGSGKSVTAYSIMRLVDRPGKIVSGNILFDDIDLAKASENQMTKIRGKRISMIFQEPLTSLNPIFKIGRQIDEVILTHQKVSKREARRQSIEMLEKVGIGRAESVYHSYPHLLSGGMRQRVMIAIALACSPELLIADEPTTALDVTIQKQILNILQDIKNNLNTSILLITHDLGVVAEVADKVLVMYMGKIVEEADVNTLFNNPSHPYTKGLLSSTPSLDETSSRLGSIKGNVPSHKNMPKGCKFAPRCPFAMPECNEAEPELLHLNEQTKVRCILYKMEGEKNYDYSSIK